ncbi:flagellar basal body L-ring protein FlgH [Erythrobacter sp. SCSIO 43205]|uniref:flagellar basal body L-ring protein FlgH n=1 Tax=Erythrobacter sp. SCSIO 43205 TaxID=2779361 RepID=UPI001CA8E12C|nr:flagellar basal body L-ring protein FlgH [Erythrobacter sp. SCSIO 43205]UAB78727.1 flagellar basal body L-ring protein FlgH [Erythrobacter sp. SCSIO 43205]
MQIIKSLVIGAAALSLSACMSGGFKREAGFYAPPPPPMAATPMAGAQMGSKGAIFQASQGYAPLIVGNRARSLGDMLTIALVESTSTSKSTTSSTDRDGSIGLIPPTAGPLSFLNPNSIASNGQSSFAGSGSAAQQSQLNGMVSVTISAIYPNGTAEVVGEKQMVLSQGDEWIQFAGRIRLVDIDADNTIPSSRVANARVIYTGKGAVQQASRPGWLQRFFSAITPF